MIKVSEHKAQYSFPSSRKIYVGGKIYPELRVPMREIAQTLPGENPPIPVYDTSGPYTDPNISLDVHKGLPLLREPWLKGRMDCEELPAITSEYGKKRLADVALDSLRFHSRRKPLRAKSGRNVSQMHYARKGIITQEMEFIAIRENMLADQIRDKSLRVQHPGNSFGAAIPARITPEFVRDEIARGRAINLLGRLAAGGAQQC